MTTYITIKDADGALRPLFYLDTAERHALRKPIKLDDGDEFVEVAIVEVGDPVTSDDKRYGV